MKCVFWFSLQLLSETFLILSRNEQDMIKHLDVKDLSILLDFNETWTAMTDSQKIT